MKYIMLGVLDPAWAAKHADRVKKAETKLKELGIKLESIHYTQGRFDFVDVVDAPDPEAMLGFSVWYANQVHGSGPVDGGRECLDGWPRRRPDDRLAQSFRRRSSGNPCRTSSTQAAATSFPRPDTG